MTLHKWTRKQLWLLMGVSLACIAALTYSITYLEGGEVFGAFGITLFIAAVVAAWLALYPKNLATMFPGFERRATTMAKTTFVLALFCTVASVVLALI